MHLATTRVGILRGTADNGLGDEVDDNTEDALVSGLESLPASLIERSRQVFDPASGTRRTVRIVTCRVPADADVREGDRVLDRNTGIVYGLSELVRVPRSLAGQSSLTLDLRGVSGA